MQSHSSPTIAPTAQQSLEHLQDCLRGELAATETYELALKRVSHVGLHRSLQNIFSSHAERATRIERRLRQLGMETPGRVSAWGTFAALLQRGADLFGDRAAIAALEEGEDHQLKVYEDALTSCDLTTRQFIERDLLNEQRRTHALCRELKRYTQAPS